MKSLTRSFLPEIFDNPINRNLILILIATLLAAIVLVTATFMVVDQW
jgi:hypothetical protein